MLLDSLINSAHSCAAFFCLVFSYTFFMDYPDILINGKTFHFVKRSRRGSVVIYTSGELVVRVGEPAVVQEMVALHRRFESFGFPVPTFVEQGQIAEGAYYLEHSLGDKHFSELFRNTENPYGAIPPELFEQFISITETFMRAQIRSVVPQKDTSIFEKLIGPQDLAAELPDHAPKIISLYEKAITAVQEMPFVLTHGDFNPHNLFPAGVIDLESVYYAPFGYDIVTNIFSITYFPKEQGYEYHQWYCFSKEQEILYYARIDALCRELGVPEISKNREHFELLRAIWLTARNHKAPKFQQWRYELFKRQYLGL